MLKPEQLEVELIYIRLHGLEGQPYLYGDPGHITALSTAQVREMDLPGSLVFLEGCYGLEFADAFLAAGARTVVGNRKPTWGKRWFLGPANIVGKIWLRMMRAGSTAEQALTAARGAVKYPHSEGWSILGQKEARL